MQRIAFPTQLKAADDGTLSGHASIFGNVDLQGDVVEKGAFREIVTNENGDIPLLWQHKGEEPIGVARVGEDAKGLRFNAQLVLVDPLARTAHAHVKAGSVRGVSIGFDLLKDGVKIVNGVRHLVALKLHEISLVTFPANQLARVETVKSRADLEQRIRAGEPLGLTKAKAKRLAYVGWPEINIDEPECATPEDLIELFNSLK